jgi:hypothetical protein
MLSQLDKVTPPAKDQLPILEVSGGVSGSKDGTGIGHLVDGKTMEEWVREYISNRTDTNTIEEGQLETAFHFGVRMEGRFAGQSFIEAEPEIRSQWTSERGRLPWESVREPIWAGFDRGRDRKL